MSMPTIQLEVDMMERSASGKSKVSRRRETEREVEMEHWRLDQDHPGQEEWRL